MALPPFFERVYGAVGGHLGVTRDSLTHVLGNVTVAVRLGDKPTTNECWIAEFAINLLTRLYPRIAIDGPEKSAIQLRELALSINPNVEVTNSAPDATSICIGHIRASGAIFPSAGGWVARKLDRPSTKSGPDNPYSAAAAAALACAELFRRIFRQGHPERDVQLSLLDFGTKTGAEIELAVLDIGKTLFVGVGAIGNAALWVLARDNQLRGDLYLLDDENLTLANLQRYVLARYVDVDRQKVEIGKEALADGALKPYAHASKLESFTSEAQSFATAVVSVDNVEGRRVAQALLPRLLINGWTGDQALGASWHIFSRDSACLACLYHPHGTGASAIEQAAKALGLTVDRANQLWILRKPLSQEDIETAAKNLGVETNRLQEWKGKYLGDLYTMVVCGAVPLDVKGLGRVETVPLAHQSALAGIFMAAELVKRSSKKLSRRSQIEPLVSWEDILREPPHLWTKPRAREPGCICTDPDYQRVYSDKWNATG